MQSHDRTVELFRIRTEDEIRKKQARRRKRQKEKEQAKGKKAAEHDDDTQMHVDGEAEENDKKIELVDLFTPYLVVRASGKIRSFDFADDEASRAKGTTQLFTALSNNALEVYSIPPPTKSKEAVPEASRVYSVDLPGHRTDVRTLCLSSDDSLLASGSNGSLKIWNMKTTACIRTMECGHAICSTFLPGDRQVRLTRPLGRAYASLTSIGCGRNEVGRDPRIRRRLFNPYRDCEGTYSHRMVHPCPCGWAGTSQRQRGQGCQVLGVRVEASRQRQRELFFSSQTLLDLTLDTSQGAQDCCPWYMCGR